MLNVWFQSLSKIAITSTLALVSMCFIFLAIPGTYHTTICQDQYPTFSVNWRHLHFCKPLLLINYFNFKQKPLTFILLIFCRDLSNNNLSGQIPTSLLQKSQDGSLTLRFTLSHLLAVYQYMFMRIIPLALIDLVEEILWTFGWEIEWTRLQLGLIGDEMWAVIDIGVHWFWK
jgi:hypothetical protein